MNILHFIQLIVINIWVLYSLKSGFINKLISPKFNNIILFTGVLFFISSIYIFYLILKKRINIQIKFDMTFLLISFLIIALFSDKKVQSNAIIKNKYKDSVTFSKIDSVLKNTGVKQENSQTAEINKSDADDFKIVNDTSSYLNKDLMQIYQDLRNIKNVKDIQKLSYKIDTIGQIYDPSDGNFELYEKEFMLVRFLMVCCIADMVPIAIIVENNSNINFSDEEQWLRIKGKIQFIKNKKNGEYMGFLKDDNIEKISEPELLYLNPINYMTQK